MLEKSSSEESKIYGQLFVNKHFGLPNIRCFVPDCQPAWEHLRIDPQEATVERVLGCKPDIERTILHGINENNCGLYALCTCSKDYDGVCITREKQITNKRTDLPYWDPLFNIQVLGGTYARFRHRNNIDPIPFFQYIDERNNVIWKMKDLTFEEPLFRDGLSEWWLESDGETVQYSNVVLSCNAVMFMHGAGANEPYTWLKTPYPRVVNGCWGEININNLTPRIKRSWLKFSRTSFFLI